MASNQEATACLLPDKNDHSSVKNSHIVALKSEKSEKTVMCTEKRKGPSSLTLASCASYSQSNDDGKIDSEEDYDTKPPAAKKQRVDEKQAPCPLLECGPEIMRNVYSFLTLKDALEVRRTCHELHDGNVDVFQYSSLVDLKGAFGEYVKYFRERRFVLCNLGSADKLRAVLHNETISEHVLRMYLDDFVSYSKIDNAEAVSILLEHDKVSVYFSILERALLKDFTEMAKILGEIDSIKKCIEMCAYCSVNIGCYTCHRGERCTNSNDNSSKFCRPCMLAVNKICVGCKEYLCPSCFASGNFHTCEKCNGVNCYIGGYVCSEALFVCQGLEGQGCNREKCSSCITADKERWYYDDGIELCPDCFSAI